MDDMVKPDWHDFFKGKRVLVTGDTGFKGSWLVLWLLELGADVTGFALPPQYENDHYHLLGLARLMTHINGDIRDPQKFMNVCREFKPEILFHLAAQPIVRLSYDEPKLTFDTNVGGSVNILEAVRSTPSLRALVYVTSDKCYKNKDWLWGYRENDELGGHDPYSASKAAAELVFSSYLGSFFCKRIDFGAASVRAGNVIGGGDWSQDRIIPDSIKALRNRHPIVIRNPVATRPWQHVLEPLSGYLLTAMKLYHDPKAYSGAWNFGPDDHSIRTVHDLVKKVIDCWGNGEISIVAQQGAPHEARLLQLNCDKAKQLLHWRPCWNFDQAVEKTVSWYRQIEAGDSAVHISKRHIAEYMEAIDD
jgi:CDP-glucose 4,6-dehydratase